MRILRTEDSNSHDWIPRLCTHRGQPYAILSHRWFEDANHEVVFADIEELDKVANETISDGYVFVVKNPQYTGTPPNAKPGFRKLQGAANQALKDGYDYIWVDTCCIDKSSSAELSEAINSMWTWYSTSDVCYVYLADVSDVLDKTADSPFANSQWWKRGWTLQELLAPRQLTFFSSAWKIIGDKKYMDLQISEITGIAPNVINGTLSLSSVSIAQRMSWASDRTTTRIEDTAYSLMGLFGVNMALLYGEGENAFFRLQQEIMKSSDDETIFAWKDQSIGPSTHTGLLAARPSSFASSREVVAYRDTDERAPYNMTNKGLSITLQLTEEDSGLFLATLHCVDPETREDHVRIYLKKLSETSEQYARIGCHEWARYQGGKSLQAKTIYVQQFHDQQPAYEKLNDSTNNIRLLHIVPTKHSSIVKTRLIEANLKTSRYIALSYRWDRRGQEQTIWVNSEPFQVADAIFHFLQKARREFPDELFWVDSVCIYQDDSTEKLYQIKLMQHIFEHATKVVCLVQDDMDRWRRWVRVNTGRSQVPVQFVDVT